eukprot:TRINITY_DN27109_c0_g2_i1.p1 TRINITY_DN27109_c0_g2~~TRINITY_DN27109_c0_g2_i1.p1  ORF type:complete len:785 (-),score=102.60 TRINITY_DN27109_c0_g2_i1:198-2552(-)
MTSQIITMVRSLPWLSQHSMKDEEDLLMSFNHGETLTEAFLSGESREGRRFRCFQKALTIRSVALLALLSVLFCSNAIFFGWWAIASIAGVSMVSPKLMHVEGEVPSEDEIRSLILVSISSAIFGAVAGAAAVKARRRTHSDRRLAEKSRSSDELAAGLTSGVGMTAQKLRCHMLFSSPLCVERLMHVQVPLQGSLDGDVRVVAQEQVLAWGASFDTTRASLIRNVHQHGSLPAWNCDQTFNECMVKPLDELWEMTLMGVTEKVTGRTPEEALSQLLTRTLSVRSSALDVPLSLTLSFRVVRGLSQLGVEEEIMLLRDGGCDVDPHAATASRIRALLAKAECHVLHVSLHCSSTKPTLVFLEDGCGKAHVVKEDRLEELLRNGQLNQCIELVFLNTCHSRSLGDVFLRAGVRHVICVGDDKEVRDESCKLFARDFYGALCAGRTVQKAFNCGIEVLASHPKPDIREDAQVFSLLPEGDYHERCLTSQQNVSRSSHEAPLQRSWGTLPPPVEEFLGREVEVQRLLQFVHARRFVEVCGERGIGKSAIMVAAGRFISARREPFDDVRWLNLDADLAAPGSSCILRGLDELRERHEQEASRQVEEGSTVSRTLLILDGSAAGLRTWWPTIRPLLKVHGMHFVLAVTTASGSECGVASISREQQHDLDRDVSAAGLIPTQFFVRPLDPSAQARLFLQRRPQLSNMHQSPRQALQDREAIRREVAVRGDFRRPADIQALASLPWFQSLGGVPGKIIDAAIQFDASVPQTKVANPTAHRSIVETSLNSLV